VARRLAFVLLLLMVPACSDDDGDDDGTGDGEIVDAEYTEGSAEVELSGDTELTGEFGNVTGRTRLGTTALTYSDDSDGALTITLNGDASDGDITFGRSDVATRGSVGDQCAVELTQNDEDGLAGRFTCTDIPGTEGETETTVTFEGTFSATSP
jgi:hypothetical protein